MATTGTGETAASASATKREPTHSSSTPSNARSQRLGKAMTSHHHRPITRGPCNAAGCSARAPAMPSGLAQTIVTGCGASAAAAPGPRPSRATETPAASSASSTLRTASPRPKWESK